MKLTSIIANATKNKLQAAGQGAFRNIVSGAPLPTLIKPIKEYADSLRMNIGAYDAVTLPLLNLESLFDSLSEDIQVETPEAYQGKWIPVTEEEATLLMSGVVQARDILGAGKPFVSITSTSGLVYNLYPDPSAEVLYCISERGEASVVMRRSSESEGFELWSKWPSAIAPPVNEAHVKLEGIQYSNQIMAALDDYNMKASTIRDQVLELIAVHDIDGGEEMTLAEGYRELASQYTEEDTSEYTIQECIEVIIGDREPEESGVINDEAVESPVVIAQGLAVSTTINQVTIEAVDSISNCTFSKWLNNMTTWVANQHKSVVRVVKRLSTAFAQGGFKGVISVLLSMMKAQSSITDKNGVLQFTDNDKLIPKEYIVGMISQIFGVIATVISVVVSIITPIIGAIVSLLSTITFGIFGSLKKDKSDTRASLATVPEDDEQSFNLMPLSPFSLLRGECSINDAHDTANFAWYRDYYSMTGNCCALDVPGGTLFIGPGDFDSNNRNQLTKARYEFHPYGVPLRREVVREECNGVVSVKQTDVARVATLLNREGAYKLWRNIMARDHDNLSIVNADNTGVLTEEMDDELRASVIFCTLLFLQWFRCSTFASDIEIPDYDFFLLTQTPGSVAIRRKLMEDYCSYVGDDTLEVASDWKDLIEYCHESCVGTTTESDGRTTWLVLCPVKAPESTVVSMVNFTAYTDGDYLPSLLAECWDEKLNKYLNVGNAYALPPAPQYAFSAPKFNASTFWLWVGLTTVAVAAVTTAVVVGSVKFSKWKTEQRLKSIANTNSARDDYINATQGVRTTTDSEGHIVQEQFDPSSPEGKAFTKAKLKAYKSTVFKANLKSHIIGGTRFDKTSFYGDATEDSESPVGENVSSNFKSVLFGSEEETADTLDTTSSIQDFSQIINLIAGPAVAN